MKTIFYLLISTISFFTYSQTIGLTPFATGFASPVEIAHPTNDSRLFVVEQGGKIKIVNPNGTTNATPFLTLTSATISTGGERGLLGLTFHPNYATNGYFYVNYTNTGGNTVIARYTVSADTNIADASSASVILTINQPFANHNGGSLKFGPDGYLYIGMGDGGNAGDPGNRAQNPNELLGKMLRIDVDSESPYGIPPTNPYAESLTFRKEIWAVGLRNPWKFSFDLTNGNLWIADVGQKQIEEINKVSVSEAGLNYGWKCFEGSTAYSGCPELPTGYTFPIAEYSHTLGCSITGGYVYNGSLYSNFQGKYFFADYCSNKIGLLNSDGLISWSSVFTGAKFTTFGEDNNGELYIAGSGTSTIYKITDTFLAVNTFNKPNFEVYPNPAISEFYIKTKSIHFPVILRIFDSIGKLLLSQSLETNTNPINVSSFRDGIYFVSITAERESNFSSKLIINSSSK